MKNKAGWNTGQQLLINLGVDPFKLCLFKQGRSPSYTRKGPGRTHDRVSRKTKTATAAAATFT